MQCGLRWKATVPIAMDLRGELIRCWATYARAHWLIVEKAVDHHGRNERNERNVRTMSYVFFTAHPIGGL